LPVRSVRRSSSSTICTTRWTIDASPRTTIELLLSTGRIDKAPLRAPSAPPGANRAFTVAAISRAELLRSETVSTVARSLSICATSPRIRRRLSA
jgi:hypothetical protein